MQARCDWGHTTIQLQANIKEQNRNLEPGYYYKPAQFHSHSSCRHYGKVSWCYLYFYWHPDSSSSTVAIVPCFVDTLATPGSSSTQSLPSSSDSEVLNKALEIVTADKDFLSKDDLLAASLLFSNTSNKVVRIAWTLIALSNTPTVQHRFLVHQLKEAGLRTRKGKEKATANDDDDFRMLE
jgi:hypothetical protein